jgi:lipopolysaccharide transport system ATP-binding protein
LLEVGTGFHPELTGRENIYLNGAILGLKRSEVKERFDEIVAFSEVEKFLDTPVKRYSSGMHSRLAFSVAAHLNSEILIVDEVLAVGDVHFQKKCMGKMGEVSAKEGRTVIFVSHNMQAVQNLCTRVLLLNNGMLMSGGNPKEVVKKYIQTGENQQLLQEWKLPETAPGNSTVRMKRISIRPQGKGVDEFITVNTPIHIEFEFWSYISEGIINLNVELYTVTSECVFNLGSHSIEAEKGVCKMESVIPGNLLNNNTYYLNITIIKNNSFSIFTFANCITFEVSDVREDMEYYGPWPGIIRPQIDTFLYFKQIVDC